MRVRFILLLLSALLFAPVTARAAKEVRATPVLKGDQEYNAILLHISQYFVLTVPEDRSIDEIGFDIRCSFTLTEQGEFRQMEIENSVDAWTGLFEGSGTLELWLKNAVLEGMLGVPRFDMTQLRSRRARKRTIVFSFGRGQSSPMHIPSLGFNVEGTSANLNQSIEAQKQALLAAARKGLDLDDNRRLEPGEAMRLYQFQNPQWVDFTDKNIIETTKPKYSPYQQAPPIRLPQTPGADPGNLPIEISISLQ